MTPYSAFVERKSQLGTVSGFDPIWLPEMLFDFQSALVSWAITKGKAAIFADCGLGKTPMQLVWADNVVRHTGKRVLILTPLAVAPQTISEGAKFGIECRRSVSGELHAGINVTNYDRLHYFNPGDFAGVVADESSILKSFDGETRKAVTEFMRRLPYRLLCTATAAPNDYTELGTSSEALGELGYMDMLSMFFKNDQHSTHPNRLIAGGAWRFKGHAEKPFWRWVCSWARAARKPSDLGFDDGPFVLPPLIEREHLVKAETLPDGYLLPLSASGLQEQREENRRTIKERCGRVAELATAHKAPVLVWCQLNTEGDLLERLIPGAVQVSGADTDEAKEEKFLAFVRKETRVLVTKPKIGAWGLNFQHCAHVTCFPTHSYEQYYQGVRRCWRFGQKHPVHVDIVGTEGDKSVLQNQQRKSIQADAMFSNLVTEMNQFVNVRPISTFDHQPEIPAWL